MKNQAELDTYWIVVAGLHGAGKTTFIENAADYVTVRDRADMSLLTEQDEQHVLQWLGRTGGALDPDRAYFSEEERLFQRWARRVTIGEIIIEPDLRVCLYEAPGSRDFDFLWHAMSPETYLGCIVLFDSTSHRTIRDVSRIGAVFASYADSPYIFAGNKQDLPEALDIDATRDLLRFLDGHEAPVVPCTAHDLWSVKRTLIRLLELIRETYDDGIQW